MTEPNPFELLELATPYALNAISDSERAAIDRQLAAAPATVAGAFNDEVRAVRETMAVVSAATAAEPPDRLRAAVLAGAQSDTARRSRWRTAVLAAAAAIVVALAAFGAGVALRPAPTPATAEQIMAAPDVRSVSADVAGGKATVVFSRDMNAGVLLMNNVPPPSQGHRVRNVAGRRQGPGFGGHDGHRGRHAVDHAHVHRPRELQRAGVHRRTRQRITAADREDLRQTVADLDIAAGLGNPITSPPRGGTGVTTIETDYLVVGAGAMGMAFTDTLVTETDAQVVIVDRGHAPGGHWNRAYPFVRLHQPSAYYGVNSRGLGSDSIDQLGWNEGLYELATVGEICAYFERVMHQDLLPSGQVSYFPMAEYLGDGRFRTLAGGDHTVNVRKRVVDATYLQTTVPRCARPPTTSPTASTACRPTTCRPSRPTVNAS